ncbi:MAG: tRNA pseudouridine(38-40) synthase TruA [Solirubrobacterales bacterium]
MAYDGTRFRGWAAQPGLRTVQAELESALATVLREPVTLTVAGRTDSGVHATAQVVSFDAKRAGERLVRSVNAVLPRDVVVRSCDEAAPDFDARRSARSRAYRYRLLATRERDPLEQGRAMHWRHRVDRDALDAAAAAVVGRHDFTAFTPTETKHRRFERDVFRCRWEGEVPGLVCLEIEADAFMRSMVRVLVGTMLEVAGGRRRLDDFVSLLDGAPRERAGDTAPAHGLYLVGVRY